MPEHLARRLQRLEWTTRYRPVLIQTLLLGAAAPLRDSDFLYAGAFEGEAARVLDAAGIPRREKAVESVLADFQRAGFLLAHVLECPFDESSNGPVNMGELLARRVSAVLARIRRSLKPKRIVLISSVLAPYVSELAGANPDCELILDGGQPFSLDGPADERSVGRLRDSLVRSARSALLTR